MLPIDRIRTRDELLALGWSPHAIAAAVRRGDLLRLRRAWYAPPGTPFEQRIAIALGGRVGGVSAARSYGMWTGEDRDIHVSWPRHGNVARPGRRLSYPTAKDLAGLRIVSHWRSTEPAAETWRESPLVAIRQTFLAGERELAVAMADSGCRLGLVSITEVRDLLRSLPTRCAGVERAIDGRTDSGLESVVRLWLLDLGLEFELHPWILGMEVDFRIGRSLLIETDGRHFHTGEAFEVDRRRDLLTGVEGYITLRWSYPQIMTDPEGCRRRLLVALERGDHLRMTTA